MSQLSGEGLLVDVGRGTLRVGGKVPRLAAFLAEKWLGFCYVFVAAILPAVIGIGIVEAVEATIGLGGPGGPMPGWLLGAGWYAGVTLGLLSAQAVIGLVTVTVVRDVSWLVELARRTWASYTPPFTEQGRGMLDRPDWPPTEWPHLEAKRLATAFSAAGLMVGTVVTMLLLSVARFEPELLGDGVSTRLVGALGAPAAPDLPIVDLAWVLDLAAVDGTGSGLLAVALLLGAPGLVFAFAARNLLLVAEVHAWHRLAGASDRLPYGLGWVVLGLVFAVYSALTTAGLYGLTVG